MPAACFGDDAFVAKLSPAGSALVYSTYLGGSSDDAGLDIAVDSAGNAYVTGFTSSTDFPTANGLQNIEGGFERRRCLCHEVQRGGIGARLFYLSRRW